MNDIKQSASQLSLWRRVLLWTPGDQGRGWRYSVILSLTLLIIWGPALTYLKLAKPVYTSKWTLILPGTGVNAQVNLESIGQASTSSLSAYGGHSVSPKVNYKTIAESSGVLKNAAEKMKLTVADFGKPRIKLVDQTSMIFFEVKGESPEQAQTKSYALYESLEYTLSQLRTDEMKRREDSVQDMLGGFKLKLKNARNALLAYQAKSGVVAIEQFTQLTASLEQVKMQQVELVVEYSRLIGERNRLIKILGLNAKQAADALMLEADPVFQENMKHYALVGALLAQQIQKMGENHPEVVKSGDTWQAAKNKLTQRVRQLIGKHDSKTLTKLMLSSDETRGTLFERLIMLDIESHGINDKISKLKQQIAKMELRLSKDTQSAAMLDDLKRDHQISEAVFTSALARIDTGKSDIYASYPLIQILSQPNVPDKPTTPNPLYVFLGTGIATLLSLFALLILWTRKPWLRKILLSE